MRPLVEQALALDVRQLVGAVGSGDVGQIRINERLAGEVKLSGTNGCVAIIQDGQLVQRLSMLAEPCRLGGRRWWLVCPDTGRRVLRLYLTGRGAGFLSRKVAGLAYKSQQASGRVQRSHGHQARLYAVLGARYEIFQQPIPPRPRGMHRRTYAAAVARILEAQAAHPAMVLPKGFRQFLAKIAK